MGPFGPLIAGLIMHGPASSWPARADARLDGL